MQNWENPELFGAVQGATVQCRICGSVFFSNGGVEAAEANLNEHMRKAHKGSDFTYGGNASELDNNLIPQVS